MTSAAVIAAAVALIALVAWVWRTVAQTRRDAVARAERDQLVENSEARERQREAIANSHGDLWDRVHNIVRKPPT